MKLSVCLKWSKLRPPSYKKMRKSLLFASALAVADAFSTAPGLGLAPSKALRASSMSLRPSVARTVMQAGDDPKVCASLHLFRATQTRPIKLCISVLHPLPVMPRSAAARRSWSRASATRVPPSFLCSSSAAHPHCAPPPLDKSLLLACRPLYIHASPSSVRYWWEMSISNSISPNPKP